MAENIGLAQILSGIASLRRKKDLIAVIKEAQTRKSEVNSEYSRLNNEEKVALAQGNSEEMIMANMEAFEYSGVPEKDLAMAKKWFNAPKVRKNPKYPFTICTYYYWRKWNDPTVSHYKGNEIIEKATGKSVSSPRGEEEEEEEEEIEEEEESEEEEEMTVAMVAVRVEQRRAVRVE